MRKESTSEMMNPKTPAPDFEMMDLDGNTVKLSDFNGEKVYLKYWASWCPICLGGLEDINTLSAEENGFPVLKTPNISQFCSTQTGLTGHRPVCAAIPHQNISVLTV